MTLISELLERANPELNNSKPMYQSFHGSFRGAVTQIIHGQRASEAGALLEDGTGKIHLYLAATDQLADRVLSLRIGEHVNVVDAWIEFNNGSLRATRLDKNRKRLRIQGTQTAVTTSPRSRT